MEEKDDVVVAEKSRYFSWDVVGMVTCSCGARHTVLLPFCPNCKRVLGMCILL